MDLWYFTLMASWLFFLVENIHAGEAGVAYSCSVGNNVYYTECQNVLFGDHHFWTVFLFIICCLVPLLFPLLGRDLVDYCN